MITTIALTFAVLYGYGMALTMQTKNGFSSLIFKIMPFTMATVALIALVLANLEWLTALV